MDTQVLKAQTVQNKVGLNEPTSRPITIKTAKFKKEKNSHISGNPFNAFSLFP